MVLEQLHPIPTAQHGPNSTSRTCFQCAAGWHSPPSTFLLACSTSDFSLGPPGKRMPAPSPAGGLSLKPTLVAGGLSAACNSTSFCLLIASTQNARVCVSGPLCQWQLNC